MIENTTEIKYSLVKSYNKESEINNEISDIKALLLNGIKIIIILNKNIDKNIIISKLQDEISNLKEFEKHKFLQIYHIHKEINTDLHIIDGDKIPNLEKIQNYIPEFNFEQYKAEHTDINKNIVIQASAGTGKTTVMIDRILYLIHMDEKLKFNEITMITFTKEATQNMKQKLNEKILMKYKLTKNNKYLKYMEEVSSIDIKTIHSFSKALISKLGISLGYGTNVKIRGFKKEKDEIILNVVNKYFQNDISFKASGIKETLRMTLSDFVKLINTFWSEVEKKAIPYEEVKNIDWGDSYNLHSESIHNIIVKIFKDIDSEFNKLKYEENAIGLSGITRELDRILDDNVDTNQKSKLKNIKYLFIDEFQDTDDIQIKLIHWLYKNLNTKIFAVGDIKQSIYRFRGTNDTAFEEIKARIDNIEDINLIKNYRTSKDIIGKLNRIFLSWGNENLIPYGVKDQIVPMNNDNGKLFIIKNEMNHEERIIRCLNYYSSIFEVKNNNKTNKIVALVRSRYEASQIKRICEQNTIPYYIDAGGSFYISDAVKEFFSLIGAYLFYEEPNYKMNYLESSYFRNYNLINIEKIYKQNGDKVELNIIIDDLLKHKDGFKIKSFYEYKEELRIKPVMQVIKAMIKDEEIINNYYNKEINRLSNISKSKNKDVNKIKDIAKANAERYEKNLNKLLEIINEKFSGDFCSLNKLYQFLLINIKTNREEDEERLEDNETLGYIHCMTVHKAKGLEFDTVILPYINSPLIKSPKEELIFYKNDYVYLSGWKIDNYKNTNYDMLREKENKETIKEETRILYVALTRAINNLICIESTYNKHAINWSALIKGTRKYEYKNN